MKTLIKPLLFALSLSLVTSAVSFGEAKPIGRPTAVASYKSGVYMTSTGKLSIALDKETGGSVNIQLKTADGYVLYTQQLGKNERTYRTRLNLSDLEDGVYYVEISNGAETTRHAVTIQTDQPQRVVRMEATTGNE